MTSCPGCSHPQVKDLRKSLDIDSTAEASTHSRMGDSHQRREERRDISKLESGERDRSEAGGSPPCPSVYSLSPLLIFLKYKDFFSTIFVHLVLVGHDHP
jgi:hypothetical protein